MNKFKSIFKPHWFNKEHTSINAEVELITYPDKIEYTFVNDKEHSDIWNDLLSGKFGAIEEYQEKPISYYSLPPITFDNLVDAIKYKRDIVLSKRTTKIAEIYNTPTENLINYELKLTRLMGMAYEMKIDPKNFFGTLFNGELLPNIDSAIVIIANDFINNKIQMSTQIEITLKEANDLLMQIGKCETLEELNKIAV